jgi:hypothetical protein
MKPSNAILAKLIRATGAIASIGLAGSIVVGECAMIRSLVSKHLSFEIVTEVVFGILVLAIPAGLVWLAWRLWCRWNVSTVRLFVGVCLAMFLLWADMLPMRWMNSPGSQLPDRIGSIAAVPLLVFGGFAYRYLTRTLIRLSGLEDELDMYGQPIGHQSRIRNFAGLLGWVVFLAGMAVDEAVGFTKRPDSWQATVAMLSPIVVGYSTYRLIVWYSKPRRQPSLPAGGFEVIVNPTRHAE